MAGLRDELIKRASEFLCISEDKVNLRIKNNVKNAVDDWNKKDSINGFYQSTDVYIYGLIDYCSEKRILNNLFPITDVEKADILDFGGGIGVHSLILSRLNNVFYYDLESKTKEFAKYINKTMNGSITFIDDEKDVYEKKYDVILALDVLEHLVNPIEAVMKLTNALRPGGYLITTGLDFSIGPNTPMHLVNNLNYKDTYRKYIEKNYILIYFYRENEATYCFQKGDKNP
jgi:2-polyprenyl-3-methyl-5-hydroxy-6-metoxy-1,4-benzoquinol methylase